MNRLTVIIKVVNVSAAVSKFSSIDLWCCASSHLYYRSDTQTTRIFEQTTAWWFIRSIGTKEEQG